MTYDYQYMGPDSQEALVQHLLVRQMEERTAQEMKERIMMEYVKEPLRPIQPPQAVYYTYNGIFPDMYHSLRPVGLIEAAMMAAEPASTLRGPRTRAERKGRKR